MIKPFAAALCVLATVSLSSVPTHAQLLDQLKGAAGGGAGSGGIGPGGIGADASSVNRASPGNIAGLLQYCVKNNYLSDGSASSVKDSLVNKMSGSGRGASDPAFKAGSSGTLEAGGAQNFNLGGGIKEQASKKVCDLVLQHAKSLM